MHFSICILLQINMALGAISISPLRNAFQPVISTLNVACSCRCVHTTPSLQKNRRTGVPKITKNRSLALTYEQAQQPNRIGVTKYWNSINTSMFAHLEQYYKG